MLVGVWVWVCVAVLVGVWVWVAVLVGVGVYVGVWVGVCVANIITCWLLLLVLTITTLDASSGTTTPTPGNVVTCEYVNPVALPPP